MQIELIRIGNSLGIRLPQAIIEQAGLTPPLELEVSAGQIVIRSARPTREGWEEAALHCAQSHEDDLEDWDAVIDDSHRDW